MPDCSHWTISDSSRSFVPVARLSLNALRRYWYPARNIIISHLGPPLCLPVYLRLSPSSWRLFWSLDLPAKAFTSWWRLLHDRVARRSWLHRSSNKSSASCLCFVWSCIRRLVPFCFRLFLQSSVLARCNIVAVLAGSLPNYHVYLTSSY
ncbi:hypothetical protein BD408DRAFT_411890 [Parasitella parasitica]|nr:hypothetical protein BD408DRAFT_411890 [Parasitella parasitica]